MVLRPKKILKFDNENYTWQICRNVATRVLKEKKEQNVFISGNNVEFFYA